MYNQVPFCFWHCRALVEVKPILFVADVFEATISDVKDQRHSRSTDYWGFQHANWHESCIQKCIVPGKLCAVVLSVSSELAAMICDKDKGDHQKSVIGRQMDRVLRFCLYLLDKIIMENDFGWEDTMVCVLTNTLVKVPSSILFTMLCFKYFSLNMPKLWCFCL